MPRVHTALKPLMHAAFLDRTASGIGALGKNFASCSLDGRVAEAHRGLELHQRGEHADGKP